MAWYSGVSGGFSSRPNGFVGSNAAPMRSLCTLAARRHWPPKSGYLLSSNAAALAAVTSSAATNAGIPVELGTRISSSLSSQACRAAGAAALNSRLATVVGHYPSIDGEAVNPARASGVVERLPAAPLAHMRSIPRSILAACPVHVTHHGARPVRRKVRVLLRQGHAVGCPVVAGVVNAVGERPAE